MEIKRIITVTVLNEHGVLSRISGLFAGRGYNIESLTVAPIFDTNLSRITITTQGDKKVFSLKKKIISLFLFVALPLPFTGVWTGACIAVALGLNFWQSTATVVLGNAVAGLIVMAVSALFGDATIIFLYAFLAIIVAGLLFFATRAIVYMIKKKRNS